MDPNATLQAIRAIVDAAHEDGSEDDLVEHVAALDEWLTRGGFLPTSWQR